MSLVIIGSLAFDTIETPLERREKIVGGSGTYCALAASFFTQPKVVGVVGRDFPETDARTSCKSRKIDTRGVSIKAGKTFHWEGRYGDDPNQRTTVRTDLNVFADFKPELPPSYRSADILYLANIDPDLHGPILLQARRPRLVAMDTIRLLDREQDGRRFPGARAGGHLLRQRRRSQASGRGQQPGPGGQKLLEMGPSLIVVKKGEHGALVFGRDFIFGVPARPCEDVVDPTGAGDSFAGGFLGYLDKAGTITPAGIRRAAVYGSVVASFAIEDFGIDRFLTLTSEEIEARFREFKRLVSF